MTESTFVWAPGAQDGLKVAAGYGLLNVLLYGEDRAKAVSVVRGGNRSFLNGSHLGGPLGIVDVAGTSRAKATVGGTLRRSWHAIVYVNGNAIPGSRVTDDNGTGIPDDYPQTGEVAGFLGTNCGYGGWVDGGTSRMPARPMLVPTIGLMQSAFESLFQAGFRKGLERVSKP